MYDKPLPELSSVTVLNTQNSSLIFNLYCLDFEIVVFRFEIYGIGVKFILHVSMRYIL